MSLRLIQGESDCKGVDTSNYHLRSNNSNVKLVSSSTADHAFLTAPCFLCCTEAPTVCDCLVVLLHCGVWSHPALCFAALSSTCARPKTHTWHCTKITLSNAQVVEVKKGCQLLRIAHHCWKACVEGDAWAHWHFGFEASNSVVANTY